MASPDQDAWIRRVLGLDVAGLAGGSEDAAGGAALLKERLAIVLADAGLLGAQEVVAAARTALAAVDAGDPPPPGSVDRLEEEVARLTAVARLAEAGRDIGRAGLGRAGAVAFAKVRLRWQAARASFADAVTNVGDGLRALLETDEFQEDPRSHDPDTLDLIDALAARLPRLDEVAGAIDDALDSAGDDAEGRRRRLAAATAQLDRYEARLAEFAPLREYEATEAGAFPSISLIEASVAELKDALAAARAGSDTDAQPQRTAA